MRVERKRQRLGTHISNLQDNQLCHVERWDAALITPLFLPLVTIPCTSLRISNSPSRKTTTYAIQQSTSSTFPDAQTSPAGRAAGQSNRTTRSYPATR